MRKKMVLFTEKWENDQFVEKMIPDPVTGKRKKTRVVTKPGRGVVRNVILETESNIRIELPDGSVLELMPDDSGAALRIMSNRGPDGQRGTAGLCFRPKSSNVGLIHTCDLHDEDLNDR